MVAGFLIMSGLILPEIKKRQLSFGWRLSGGRTTTWDADVAFLFYPHR
jgi:hypothetical protein